MSGLWLDRLAHMIAKLCVFVTSCHCVQYMGACRKGANRWISCVMKRLFRELSIRSLPVFCEGRRLSVEKELRKNE